jgi:hypothetical protein
VISWFSKFHDFKYNLYRYTEAAVGPKYPIIKALLPTSLEFANCAIVGNSQRMLLQEDGEEIDDHDVVGLYKLKAVHP